jgi:hypothetical protein
MTKSSETFDRSTKVWLVVLLAGFVGFVAILASAFINGSSRPVEPIATVEQSAPAEISQVRAMSEPTWSYPEPSGTEHSNGNQLQSSHSAVKREQDAATNKAFVHRQAETFREMVKQNKVPGGLGDLTLEKIDEMEKNNVGVW